MWISSAYRPGPSRRRSSSGWCIDWIKTDRAYTEEQLTSSREGEIEALSEKHKV